MSRITKYLKQKCQLATTGRSTHPVAGDNRMNRYGELQYVTKITLACRREPCTRDIQTANGALVRSSDRYYLDAGRVIHNDDLLDGKPILTINGLVDQFGRLIGYECYV